MKQNETNLVPKSSKKFECVLCEYNTSRKSQYERHLSTLKHKNCENVTNLKQTETKSSKKFQNLSCNCGVLFNNRTTLWRHKKKCTQQMNPENYDVNKSQDYPTNIITTELVMELIKDNKEMKQIILEQNNTINSIVKNGITNNSHNTNSLNKTFNLQLFLNETCKNAMNITDFINSIQLQLSDLEKVGEVGYVKGISDIITNNLKALDVTQRPIHCTDKKRETLYIKDENKWEKEDDNKNKLRKAIKKVANKNISLIQEFKKKYPDCIKSTSKQSDKYNKIIVEAMGGSGDNDTEKEDKIIKNISNITTIDKEINN